MAGLSGGAVYEVLAARELRRRFVESGEAPRGAAVELGKSGDWAAARVMGARVVFFGLNEKDLHESASIVVSRMSEMAECVFVAVCDGRSSWAMFARMCGNPENLKVCVSADAVSEAWESEWVYGVVLSNEVFSRGDGRVALNGVGERACRMAARNEWDLLVLESDGAVECVREFVASVHETRVSFEAYMYAQYRVAMKKAAEAKPGRKWVIITSARSELVDIAIEVGAKEVLVLGKRNEDAVFLQMRNEVEWSSLHDLKVEVARFGTVVDDAKAGILVTDLLGVCGDDQLCPEILAGSKHLISDDAVVIPSSCTSYVAPSSNQRVWTQANNDNKVDQVVSAEVSECTFLSSPQKLFEFRSSGEDTLYWSKTLMFEVCKPGILYGFCSWFSCTLCDGVVFVSGFCDDNVHREQAFFPLPFQVDICEADVITFHISRKTNDVSMWYEWCTTGPTVTPLQNCQGKNMKELILRPEMHCSSL